MPDGASRVVPFDSQPYLSLVVTARNDDHGGNLLGRMQAFLSGWIAQACRYRIPSEIVVVEWNPPAERPRLVDALHWPRDCGPCSVRFIEVPSELHRHYGHADALPLYQMIAKNVGIRRAQGSFILATNIDILFSDELAAFLAERRLQAGRMYRIDRHDAMSALPEGGIAEHLQYCRSHLIRVNRREGTFNTTSDGRPILAPRDVAADDSGILFGQGWLPVEIAQNDVFRWALPDAELLLPNPVPGGAGLWAELAHGPGAGIAPLDLEIETGDRRPVTRVVLEGRTRLLLRMPQPSPASLHFKAHGAATRVAADPRVLALRAFRFEWAKGDEAFPREPKLSSTFLGGWKALQYAIAKLATGGPLVPLLIPVSPRIRRYLRAYVRWGGFGGMVSRGIPHLLGMGGPPPEMPESAIASMESSGQAEYADFLHTNACGDFTLMARQHWCDLRGYPEFDLFSMNLDSVLCFAAHHGGATEEVLPDPMRIYHLEHGSGSGWTPEGQAKLFERIAAKGLSFMDNAEVLDLAARMRRLRAPMIFNLENWGLSGIELKESTPLTRGSGRREGV